MSVLFYACLLFWNFRPLVVGEELAPPQNVTLITLNTDYMLTWDWPQTPAESHIVTFTTEYAGKYMLQSKRPRWSMVCNKTLEKSCDLTAANLHYLGIYMIRVRANMMGLHSVWVQKEFCPDKDAALGPPTKVTVTLDKSNLEISILEPLTSTNISMKNHIPTLKYHIVYWEHSAETQSQMLTSDATLVYLSDLKSWTWYCVSVRSSYDFYKKSSIFTPVQCIQTEGHVPWWQIFLYFLGSLLIVFLVMLLSYWIFFRCYKTLKATFFPSDQLPPHLNQYLCGSTGSDIPGLLIPDPECELLCERAIVCKDPQILQSPTLEALNLEPENSESCQNTSGDSGVFSTGGSSNVQESSGSQFCTVVKDFCWAPFELNQVKFQSIGMGLIGQPINAS